MWLEQMSKSCKTTVAAAVVPAHLKHNKLSHAGASDQKSAVEAAVHGKGCPITLQVIVWIVWTEKCGYPSLLSAASKVRRFGILRFWQRLRLVCTCCSVGCDAEDPGVDARCLLLRLLGFLGAVIQR